MGRADLSQCAAYAQRSIAVWESWKLVENAINRYDVVLPMHVSMTMNLLASRVIHLSYGPESIHSRREEIDSGPDMFVHGYGVCFSS